MKATLWTVNAVLLMPLTVFAQAPETTAPAVPPAAEVKADTPPAAPAPAAAPAQPAPTTAAPAAAAPAPAATSEPAAAPAEPDASYGVRLKGLEQRVDELKEKIFRSKARLNLLKETVLHGVIAGSRSVIMHKNEMGSSFRLVKAVYALDGQQIFAKSDEADSLAGKEEFEIFNGSVVPGDHTISALLVYRGHGFGIFSYLKGYKFTVRSSHTFTAAEGKQTIIKVVGYEKGNFTTDLQDRPAIDFRVTAVAAQGGAGAKE